MINLIDTTKGDATDVTLRAMFAARKEVFVDLLGWDVPVLDRRFEMDQFDDENARYLILTDDDLNHLGSARLLPTTRPHLLDTLFPALCAGPVPQGADVFEITRFCLSRGLSGRERREVRNRLITAMVEFAMAITSPPIPAWPSSPGCVRYWRSAGTRRNSANPFQAVARRSAHCASKSRQLPRRNCAPPVSGIRRSDVLAHQTYQCARMP